MRTLVVSVGILTIWTAGAAAQMDAATVSPMTQDFVTKVANSDLFEIQSSRFILPNADADTKPFATKMIADHTLTSSQLKAFVQGGQAKAQLPTTLDAETQAKLDDMEKLTGTELDQSYDQMQVQAHKDAVALFQKYAADGDNPALKNWAGKTLPTLQQHLAMAQALK